MAAKTNLSNILLLFLVSSSTNVHSMQKTSTSPQVPKMSVQKVAGIGACVLAIAGGAKFCYAGWKKRKQKYEEEQHKKKLEQRTALVQQAEKIHLKLIQQWPYIHGGVFIQFGAKETPIRYTHESMLRVLGARLDLMQNNIQNNILGLVHQSAHRSRRQEIIEHAVTQKNVSVFDLDAEHIVFYLRDIIEPLHFIRPLEDRDPEKTRSSFKQLIIHGELHIPALVYALHMSIYAVHPPIWHDVTDITVLAREVFPYHNRRKQLVEESLTQLPPPLTKLALHYANNESELPVL